MTGREICMSYRQAKDKKKQMQILAELNNVKRIHIIKILLEHGEKLPPKEMEKLYERLDVLDGKIYEMEEEYREIVNALNSRGNKKKKREESKWRQVSL